MQIRFASAEVDVIVHATEDQLKILDVIEHTLKIEQEKFIINKLEGHHGNEIILMKARLDGNDATRVAHHIIESLNRYDRRWLADNLDNHIERNSLYIRISKQDLFNNSITFGDDAIKIRFKVKGFNAKLEFDNLRKVLVEKHG